MLLLFLSQRYTSPIVMIDHIPVHVEIWHEQLYFYNRGFVTIVQVSIPSGGSGCESVTQIIWYVEFTGLHPWVP